MVNFGHVVTAMITPFKEDGSVNYEVAERLAVHLAENGTDTLVVCGTTGESPTLTWDEEYQLFQVVQKAVAGKAKVMAGTGSNSTQEAISATQKAAKIGLDGSLQVVPYYNKPPQSGLYHHFKA
ncbi:MAG: dihydrodipicolinate synthase family protein, partial [Cyanobacteriota bacterium]